MGKVKVLDLKLLKGMIVVKVLKLSTLLNDIMPYIEDKNDFKSIFENRIFVIDINDNPINKQTIVDECMLNRHVNNGILDCNLYEEIFKVTLDSLKYKVYIKVM